MIREGMAETNDRDGLAEVLNSVPFYQVSPALLS
jgi:hypothetical protein